MYLYREHDFMKSLLELEGKLMIRNSCISAAESTWSDYCI